MNESPAPTVSTRSVRETCTLTRPQAETASAPSSPRVTTTSSAPRISQDSATSIGSMPGRSHCRSSSLTLTTSATPT